jgi:hypothetical protein
VLPPGRFALSPYRIENFSQPKKTFSTVQLDEQASDGSPMSLNVSRFSCGYGVDRAPTEAEFLGRAATFWFPRGWFCLTHFCTCGGN